MSLSAKRGLTSTKTAAEVSTPCPLQLMRVRDWRCWMVMPGCEGRPHPPPPPVPQFRQGGRQ
jgi:hypothetical protein